MQAGVDPTLKSERFYNYVKNLRKEILEITHACGYEHPCQMKMEDVELSAGGHELTKTLKENYGYEKADVPFVSFANLKDNYLGGVNKTVLEKA